MAKTLKAVAAIKGNDWKTALAEVSKILDNKITQALATEKQDIAAGLLVPRLAEVYINVGDRIRTKRMGQTAGTVVKVENGNVYFELDEPEGKFGKRVWAAPLSNVVKEAKTFGAHSAKCQSCGKPFQASSIHPNICARCDNKERGTRPVCSVNGCWSEAKWYRKKDDMPFCAKHAPKEPLVSVKEAMGHVGSTPADKGRMAAADDDYNRKYEVDFKKKDGTTVKRKVTVPPSNNEAVNEDAVSQHEVQRIYDEIGDIGETELLCGISSLRVNPQGQVISYICESRKNGLPEGVKACGPDCAKGDDVDPDYYCGEGLPWNKHKGWLKEATGTGFPNGWERGWTYPYKIGGGGTERPFVKDGRWYLLVYNQETSKREVYSFYDDVFVPEKEFYKD